MALGAHLDVGSDGVAIITLENGKVNAMHPTGPLIPSAWESCL